MAVEQGSVLAGRFAVGELLGRGGMADVYRGEDQVLGRAVAIKVFRGVEGNASEKARFEAEGRTLAGLSHPGLVTLLDVGTDNGNEFLVMELVDGPTLSTRLGEPMPEAEVADLGRQVAQALAYAHAQGVIHRDIKPGNILLGRDGRAKIADFGIARLVDQATQHTQDGMAIGSPAYLAPEQVMGTEVSGAADVWSLGLVLLECLTGRREYAGTSMEAAMARLHRGPVVPDDLSEGWQRLLRAMTASEPDSRPGAAEVAAAIPESGLPSPGQSSPEQASPGASSPGQHGSDTLLLTQVPAGADPESTQPWAPAGSARTASAAPTAGATPAGSAAAEQAEWPGAPARSGQADRPPQPEPRGPRGPRGPRWMVLAATLAVAVIVAIVVLVMLSGGDPPPAETDIQIPEGVPTQFEEPLTDLHDAIHGSQQ